MHNLTGYRVDGSRLDFELARRGLRPVDLARLAGLTPLTISKARHGEPIKPRTLRAIGEALTRVPVIENADLILPAPSSRVAP